MRERFRNRAPGPGQTPVHVGDPRFDEWEVVLRVPPESWSEAEMLLSNIE